MQTTEYLSPPKAAKLLGVGVDKITREIRAGNLRAFNLSEATRPRWRISREDLDAWLHRRSNQKPAPSRRVRRPIPVPSKQYV